MSYILNHSHLLILSSLNRSPTAPPRLLVVLKSMRIIQNGKIMMTTKIIALSMLISFSDSCKFLYCIHSEIYIDFSNIYSIDRVKVMKEQKRVLFFTPDIPVIANQLEAMLYFYSPTREYYSDRSTLTERVCDSLYPGVMYNRVFIAPCCTTKSEMFISQIVFLIIVLLYWKRMYIK
jgi:hypothetical protein